MRCAAIAIVISQAVVVRVPSEACQVVHDGAEWYLPEAASAETIDVVVRRPERDPPAGASVDREQLAAVH